MDVEDKSAFGEAQERAADKPAFSSGPQQEIWSRYVCGQCIHEENCILIDVAMLGKTPAEWTKLGMGDYQCSGFSRDGP